MPNQENSEGIQPVQSHSHTQQPLQPQTCVHEHFPDEIGLYSSGFQAVLTCVPIDSLAFPKVVNEHNQHNALCMPSDGRHQLPCRWHHLGLLWRGDEGCFHCMDCHLVSGSKRRTQHSSWVRKRSRKLALLDLLQKVLSFLRYYQPSVLLIRRQKPWHPPSGNGRQAKFDEQNALYLYWEMSTTLAIWLTVKRLSFTTLWTRLKVFWLVAVAGRSDLGSFSRLSLRLLNSAAHICTVDKAGHHTLT